MDLEVSRSGFYTLTFLNKNNLDEASILKEFNTVGHVRKLFQHFNRVFIRFKEKKEAERALSKFGKIYDLDMAINKNSDSQQHSEAEFSDNHHHNRNRKPKNHSRKSKNRENRNRSPKKGDNSTRPSSVRSRSSSSSRSMEKLDSPSNIFHLILGNLPKNYTTNDINSLVEEAKPVCINQLDETRVFHLKFCHIVLDSVENLNYLINKLNGFVICGEKLIAAEAKNLLEWKEKLV